VHFPGTQATAFRWRLDAAGNLAGHDLLPANLLGHLKRST
jgi:hypothetical protein